MCTGLDVCLTQDVGRWASQIGLKYQEKRILDRPKPVRGSDRSWGGHGSVQWTATFATVMHTGWGNFLVSSSSNNILYDHSCSNVCVCVCVYAFVYLCIDGCMYVWMYEYVCMCVCVCVCICICTCLYVCMCVCMYVCVYIHIYVCVCVCVYTGCLKIQVTQMERNMHLLMYWLYHTVCTFYIAKKGNALEDLISWSH